MRDSREESKLIADTLTQLNNVLSSEKLKTVYSLDLTETNLLKESVTRMLNRINADTAYLDYIKGEDIFGNDPSFAGNRYKMISSIESIRTDFQFNIFPKIEQITNQVLQQAKEKPDTPLDYTTIPPKSNEVEKTTIGKVLDKAEQIINHGKRAMAIASKAYMFVKGLGLLLGIYIP
jgi:hypothetical protein